MRTFVYAWTRAVLIFAVLALSLGPADGHAACVGGAPDGIVQPGEQCDDGNTNNTDGCSNDCTIPPTCAGAQTVLASAAPALMDVNAFLDCYKDFASVYRANVLILHSRGANSPLAPFVAIFDRNVTSLLNSMSQDVVPNVSDTDLTNYVAGLKANGLVDEAVATEARLTGGTSRRRKPREGSTAFDGLNRSLTHLIDRDGATDHHGAIVAAALVDVLNQVSQIAGNP